MKKLSILLPALLLAGGICVPAAAQQADTTVISDTTGVTELIVRTVGRPAYATPENSVATANDNSFSSGNRPSKRWKWHGGHWAGVGIYYNGLVQSLGHLSLPSGAGDLRQSARSIGVNVNLADLVIVSNRHFGLITGLGLEMNNFRFDRNIGLTTDAEGATVVDYSYAERGIELSKSKLTTVYLNIPLLAEFQFGRGKYGKRSPGFVNFGLVGGVLLQGHTKIQYTDPQGGKHTDKQHKDLNLRNFHYGAQVNVGYKWVAVSATYYPQSIFAKDLGPDVQQVNIGLSFMF